MIQTIGKNVQNVVKRTKVQKQHIHIKHGKIMEMERIVQHVHIQVAVIKQQKHIAILMESANVEQKRKNQMKIQSVNTHIK